LRNAGETLRQRADAFAGVVAVVDVAAVVVVAVVVFAVVIVAVAVDTDVVVVGSESDPQPAIRALARSGVSTSRRAQIWARVMPQS